MYPTKKRILVILMVAVVIAAGYALSVWFKPQRDVSIEKGLEISAVIIFDSFATNEKNAYALYLNKAVQVTGEVSEIKKNQEGETVIYLKTSDPIFGVNCTFKQTPEEVKNGDIITFKGLCTGYTSDVVLKNGLLVKIKHSLQINQY